MFSKCDANQTTNLISQTEVEMKCPEGTFSDRTGLRGENECQTCPRGFYCSPDGQTEPVRENATVRGIVIVIKIVMMPYTSRFEQIDQFDRAWVHIYRFGVSNAS